MLVSLVLATATPDGSSLPVSEEPETALHPAATAFLVEILRKFSRRIQIIVLCHSHEMVSDEPIDPATLWPVGMDARGRTFRGERGNQKW